MCVYVCICMYINVCMCVRRQMYEHVRVYVCVCVRITNIPVLM